MSKKVRFYMFGLMNNEMKKSDINMADFFNIIDEQREAGRIKARQNINNKTIKLFKLKRAEINGNDSFLVPFGTLKQGITYTEAEGDSSDVGESTMNIYDITFLYVNSKEKVCFLTADRSAPSYKDIIAFINGILKTRILQFFLKPVSMIKGLPELKKANVIRSITLRFNLSCFESMEMSQAKKVGVFSALNELVHQTLDELEGKKFSITIKTTRSQREKLNKEQLLILLEAMDIESDAIDEISIDYKKSSGEKTETIRLKDVNRILEHEFNNTQDNTLKSAFLLDNADSVLSQHRLDYSTQVRYVFLNSIHINISIEDLIDATVLI